MFRSAGCADSDFRSSTIRNGKDFHSISILRTFQRDQDVFECDHRCDWWYRIVSGATRKYRIRSDGRRQIADIHLPGDFFGFSSNEKHGFSVQAIVEGTTIACYPRGKTEALADSDPSIARFIRVNTFAAIERLEQQMLVVSTMSAPERVKAFLVHFRDRVGRSGEDDLALPITRYDIADLLGLSTETVCRAFTDLRERGAISLEGPRQVTIIRPGSGND
ncbi:MULTISPECIES: helix-turn-helix domain-containing protein [Rhodoplanes]|uniref:helix-turn-helix domain-containing protein n=1 Tax=Rhodoplanes TaxID=29407 RepID=UPI00101CE268|nr:helix-turn-helix domain-containing protein [Rhodoplanes serenus]